MSLIDMWYWGVVFAHTIQNNQDSGKKVFGPSNGYSYQFTSPNQEVKVQQTWSNVIIVPWKGPLPSYSSYFLNSLLGKELDVVFVSVDNSTLLHPSFNNTNIKQIYLSHNFVDFVTNRLCLVYNCSDDEFATISAIIEHKSKDMNQFSDFKPFYPYIFADFLDSHDYITWGDINTMFGDYKRIKPYLSMNYDLITASASCQYRIFHSGRFTAIKNRIELLTAWQIPITKQVFISLFSSNTNHIIEEGIYSHFIMYNDYTTLVLPWQLADIFYPHYNGLSITEKGLEYDNVISTQTTYKVKALQVPTAVYNLTTKTSCDISWFDTRYATCIPYTKDGFYATIHNGTMNIFQQTEKERNFTLHFPFMYTFHASKLLPGFHLESLDKKTV